MLNVLNESLLWVNLPFTILLGIIILLWLTVFLGALDLDIFHIDVDADADFDVHVDVHADVDADAGGDISVHHGGFFFSALKFFHIGEMPIMVPISFLILSLWSISVLGNHYLGNEGFLLAAALFVPNLIVSSIFTKIVSMPFRAVFRKLNEDEAKEHANLLGKTCVVLTTKLENSLGQVEIKTSGAPLRLNAKALEGQTLFKGDHALIIDVDEEKKVFTVEKLEAEG